MKNWFKNQFLSELSQKVKEIGSYLEIMSFRSIRTHFKQIFYYRWCNAATPFFVFFVFFFCKKCINTVFQGIWFFSRHIWILETLESLIFAFNFTALCLWTNSTWLHAWNMRYVLRKFPAHFLTWCNILLLNKEI